MRSDPHKPHKNTTPTAVLKEGNAPLLLRKYIQDSMSADRFIDISGKEIIAQQNAKLINGYRTLGLSVEEIRELGMMGARSSI